LKGIIERGKLNEVNLEDTTVKDRLLANTTAQMQEITANSSKRSEEGTSSKDTDLVVLNPNIKDRFRLKTPDFISEEKQTKSPSKEKQTTTVTPSRPAVRIPKIRLPEGILPCQPDTRIKNKNIRKTEVQKKHEKHHRSRSKLSGSEQRSSESEPESSESESSFCESERRSVRRRSYQRTPKYMYVRDMPENLKEALRVSKFI
jgi:hypothetical protein